MGRGVRQLLLLITLWTGVFCNYACYSIIAPFFPQLARKKGLSAEQYSLVFGVYSLSQVFFCCVVGKCLTASSSKFTAVSGLFLTGGATVLFGCVERSPGHGTFLGLCLAIRGVEGAGFAAFLTSALALLVRTFPARPGYYVGLTETVITVAMISGPPLGSLLFTAGGYLVPFVTFGSLILVTSVATFAVVASEHRKDHRRPFGNAKPLSGREMWRLVRLPAGAMTLICVTGNVTADAFVLISLSDHLSQFGLSTMEVGGVYLCLFLSYGVSAPLAGRLADRSGREFLLQSIGSLVVAAAFTLLGPASFLPLKTDLRLVVGGLLLKGLGAGPLISCSFSAALRAAKNSGLPDDFRTYSLVSTLVSFSIPLGNLIGGLTTGVLCERLGMRPSTTLYAGAFLALSAGCLVVHWAQRTLPPRSKRWTRRCRKSASERTLLLLLPRSTPSSGLMTSDSDQAASERVLGFLQRPSHP